MASEFCVDEEPLSSMCIETMRLEIKKGFIRNTMYPT
jgi:hypothetical protein